MPALLDYIASRPQAPLIVAEGSADDKRAAIIKSSYLEFAHRMLSQFRGPLVIFGSELGPSDQHLVEAIHPAEGRRLAIALLGSHHDQHRAVARYTELFYGAEITFFNAQTHPLGAAALAIGHGPV
jgi:hypothetical protein